MLSTLSCKYFQFSSSSFCWKWSITLCKEFFICETVSSLKVNCFTLGNKADNFDAISTLSFFVKRLTNLSNVSTKEWQTYMKTLLYLVDLSWEKHSQMLFFNNFATKPPCMDVPLTIISSLVLDVSLDSIAFDHLFKASDPTIWEWLFSHYIASSKLGIVEKCSSTCSVYWRVSSFRFNLSFSFKSSENMFSFYASFNSYKSSKGTSSFWLFSSFVFWINFRKEPGK